MIYIHIPFCKSFCRYCGFYSECYGEGDGSVEAFEKNLMAEIQRRRGEDPGPVKTVYIGGGTPSVLPLSVLERIVGALPAGSYDEFTVEVNPEDIVTRGMEYVRGLRSLGVNRVSMGVQSLSDEVLRWMHRRHTAERAVEAFRMLREGGFDNVSLDVIFGVAGFPDAVLEETMEGIIRLGPEHLSCYQLSVEEGSELAEMVAGGSYVEASEEVCRSQYSLICRMLADAGYRHYEISSWARPGYEAVHNSAYWRRVPYIGFGPGAHSFDGKRRSWNSETLPSWEASSEVLSEEDAAVERVMLALRTADGILREELPREACERLISEGALVVEGDRVRIPEERFFVSDDIIRQLI